MLRNYPHNEFESECSFLTVHLDLRHYICSKDLKKTNEIRIEYTIANELDVNESLVLCYHLKNMEM